MLKIVGVDLDGTLLNDDSHASKENLEAIKSLKNKGILTVIVTGRTFYEIPPEVRNCEEILYYIYSDGACIFSRADNKVIYENLISNSDTANALKLLKRYDTYIEIYSNGEPVNEQGRFNDDTLRYYGIDEIFINEMHRSRKRFVEFKEYANSSECKTELFDVFFHSVEERLACFDEFSKEFPHLEFTTSMPTNMEIMNKQVSKGNSFKFLCNMLKIERNSAFAIGDSKNDLSLFNSVYKGFAVNNACDELKAIASNIICSNNENVMAYINKKTKKLPYPFG